MLKEPLKGILVFSAVETVTVVAWGAVLGVGAGMSALTMGIAITVLFVGYTVEHIIAFNVGQDKPYLSWPKRKESK